MRSRRLLGKPGFEYIVDSGLGATVADYSKFRVNVFDSTGDPGRHFEDVEDQTMQNVENLMQLPAYQDLVRASGDGGCGAATLAGHSVAVPFVSAFTAALAIAQTIRIASGDAPHTTLSGDLRDVRTVRTALSSRAPRLRIPISEVN